MANVLMEEEEEEEEVLEDCEPCVAVRLVSAAAWHVLHKRQVYNYPRVLALLETIGEAAPDLVHFRHLAKIRLGLQAKVIMTMLQEEQPHGKIYDAIDTYFPENTPLSHPKATAEDLELVQAAQENFRDLVLGLLSDRRQQDKYVQEHLENDYGEVFSRVVEELFCDYLWQLESTLPEPNFQQLLEAACFRGPSQPPQPDSNILSSYFTAMGYQIIECPPHPSSSRQSIPLLHSDGKKEQPQAPESCKAQPSLGRSKTRQSCPPRAEEGDFHGHHSDSQETDESGDMVLASSSEESSPLRKGEYQCTRHNALIPTFQEHLRSRCVKCLDSNLS
ncbi:TERF1-interacting nuclear factor 2 isoform X2 [Sceloporus undulatus]|uniref:TERF1-interacting nuclear factor 2 isoform X2 n=1 Tax=Sceloporus undulatus TaxID=8520 RepID=UPI001C4BF5A2|nr:TERF1-interacting nuclear factor 2 isoform X2 [Sceloporus undulatus]